MIFKKSIGDLESVGSSWANNTQPRTMVGGGWSKLNTDDQWDLFYGQADLGMLLEGLECTKMTSQRIPPWTVIELLCSR
jgi:hypothetical protein